ncbi:hypothetical protein LPJ61_003951 [Coemansia biformis]|uniref:m7GpppX diphosphatase n=1 Tax=Coemansia biformis TaxID=1286918 RepID=A0A9W7Y5Q2_9FUNG|nr:hypothetical protein LPJ61_003951 [Coemansia biformis]
MSLPETTLDSRASIQALLCQFRLQEVLNEDPSTKTAWLLGHIGGEGSAHAGATAIVTIERPPFSLRAAAPSVTAPPSEPGQGLFDGLALDSGEQNDIYSWAAGFANTSALGPDLRVSIICPATAKHINKHRRQQYKWVRETPELYAKLVRPFIDAQPPARIQWVHNILAKRVEAERIIYEDPDPELGFVILPDLKWDTTDPASMYLVAIVHQHGIKSLRDLNGSHLPLLKNIRTKAAIGAQKYGVRSDCLRLYVHYQPSYYHLHVHITNVALVGRGMTADRAHLLDVVISNIEDIASDFYQRATLAYVLGSDDELWQRWAEHADM